MASKLQKKPQLEAGDFFMSDLIARVTSTTIVPTVGPGLPDLTSPYLPAE